MQNTIAFERRFETGIGENSSGVSWGAVIGGAFVAASVSLIMLALGAGFGLMAFSPWSNNGASSSVLGNAALAWLIMIQLISFALGGYLAGRLRTKWEAVHTDEVFFRDTANGFLVWAVGLVISVTFLVSAAATMVGNSGQPAGSREDAALGLTNRNAYFIDVLFRSDARSQVDPAMQAEAGRIVAHALLRKDPSASDIAYLSKLVEAKTALSSRDAEARVSQVLSDARQAEDTARQTTSRLLFWIFLALLIGAFSASYAATIGGKQRDHVKVI